ncbi:MAG: iron-containing alcohol dehydrogenase [Gammaproteobacteria bacterium]|nr:iron-containing alcohol dehydrogenase [Gammaproteobacteria bacterium]MDH3468495.1 iron-containing alcohol dehydrogenase [Gammaproteobacteria bacterium]
MGCCHYYEFTDAGDRVFAVDAASIKFGPGVLVELVDDVRALGMTRVAIITESALRSIEPVANAIDALRRSGLAIDIYDEVKVEPTDRSFLNATEFAQQGQFDGYVSIGGGSVIDTCKAANLYSSYPADFLDYVNPPIGAGQAVPGPLKPHIACPTTCGTGSESTGIAVFDLLSMQVKTGIASRALRPTRALIDPLCAYSLPPPVVAASGFDVLSHALESYTARPYTARSRPDVPEQRPMSQGANPFSDIGCRRALELAGGYLVRAVADAADHEAREQMMLAATLAGIAFGNSGVHVPHGMSYSVAGLVRDFYPDGYPQHEPMCPHGMSVIVNAPSAFRFTAPACPQRHLEGARLLGADDRGAGDDDAGEILANRLIEMMRATGMPNGVAGIGYAESDIPALASGAFAQPRLIGNAPSPVSEIDLQSIYRLALRYW